MVLYGMKMYEMKKTGRYDIGFIDPYIIHEIVIRDFPNEKEANLLMFLKAQNTKVDILFPYNFK